METEHEPDEPTSSAPPIEHADPVASPPPVTPPGFGAGIELGSDSEPDRAPAVQLSDAVAEAWSPAPPEEHEPQPELVWPADNKSRRLTAAAVTADRIASWIFNGILIAAVLVVQVIALALDWFDDAPAMAQVPFTMIVIAFLAWRAHGWPALVHRHRAWRLSPLAMDIWEGVVWRHVVSVPRSRVQHTEVTQGPLQRQYGLASLSIFTAGESRAEVTLEGLQHETAIAIRDCLLNREEDDVV